VVAGGQAVARLAKDGEREIVISVPESKISQFKTGMPTKAWLWADDTQHVPAQVREITASADAVTRTFAVRVTVPQLPPGAQLGMTASVAVASYAAPQLLLPLTAIIKTPRDNAASVWVVNPQTRRVALKPVTVGGYGEAGAVITSGLAGGELVVIAGAHKLLPDQEVGLSNGSAAPAIPAQKTGTPTVPPTSSKAGA
jgi:RND family efflux transporter MFP subunit